MPKKFFVKKGAKLHVSVHVWENEDGELDASHNSTQVPEDMEAEKVNFTFRKPNYADSNMIIQQSQADVTQGSIDVTSFQNVILRSLLIDWSLTDEQGQKVAVNVANIDELEPTVARAAVAAVLEKIRL